jgi:hypothetical protein
LSASAKNSIPTPTSSCTVTANTILSSLYLPASS